MDASGMIIAVQRLRSRLLRTDVQSANFQHAKSISFSSKYLLQQNFRSYRASNPRTSVSIVM